VINSRFKERIKQYTILYKLIKPLAKWLLYQRDRVLRGLFPPAIPKNPNNEVYIHLGCGEIVSDEFINVDSRVFRHIHHVHRADKLPMFQDNSANMIYASHILEHFRMDEVPIVLKEWYRILKPGGVLRVGVPDFDTIIKVYLENGRNIDHIWAPLMGGQEYKQNVHYACFNESNLTRFCYEAGFKTIRRWSADEVEHHNFVDWTSHPFIVNQINYPISLNLEAIK
jgi:predicted SAM-dependent methyltransferase